MSRLVARLREVARARGWARALWIAPRWVLRSRYDVYVFDHGPERHYRQPPELEGVRWSRIGLAEIAAAAAVHPSAPRGEVQRRLAEGQQGWLAWRGGEPVHVRWSAFDDHDLGYLGLRFRALPGDHVSGSAYTVPGRRRHGLQSTGLARVMLEVRERGCRRSLAFVASWNEPIQRVLLATGWRGPVGSIGSTAAWPPGRRRFVATGAVRLADGVFHVARDEG